MVLVNPSLLRHPNSSQLSELKRVADAARSHPVCSVMDFARSDIAARNYYSIGRYYHPNPNTANGLPYISRDGIVNPNAANGPKNAMQIMTRDVLAMAAAGFWIDKKYAHGAIARLRKWFLDCECSMNPNLENAQMVPGLNMGRPAGIIDSHIWINIIMAMDFLSATVDDNVFLDGMREWFGQYSDWLMQSDNGIRARNTGNNISVWHGAQVMTFSLFAGNRRDYISQCIDWFKSFVENQMNSDGGFDAEIKRTRSLHYCVFNLNAMALMAEMARAVDVDLWHYRTESGRGLINAFEFIAPFLNGTKTWPYNQIMVENFPTSFAFLRASTEYERSDFVSVNAHAQRPANFSDIYGPEYLWPL